MGVLPCNRNGCVNIMCNHNVRGKRLCGDCLREFEESRKRWQFPISEFEAMQKFEEFMDSNPGTETKLYADDADEFFKPR